MAVSQGMSRCEQRLIASVRVLHFGRGLWMMYVYRWIDTFFSAFRIMYVNISNLERFNHYAVYIVYCCSPVTRTRGRFGGKMVVNK